MSIGGSDHGRRTSIFSSSTSSPRTCTITIMSIGHLRLHLPRLIVLLFNGLECYCGVVIMCLGKEDLCVPLCMGINSACVCAGQRVDRYAREETFHLSKY
jgi:hypothetical protein